MTPIIICDTNAVIQLWIISPKIFRQKHSAMRMIVHTIVRQEISALKTDPAKNARLGQVFDLILKEVPADTTCHLPNQRDEVTFHRRIQKIELGMPDGMKSAGSSHADRRFLILAKKNSAKLLTNEETLFNLSVAVLGVENSWKVSDAIELLLSSGSLEAPEIQSGIDALARYQERLRTNCAEKLRKCGFTC